MALVVKDRVRETTTTTGTGTYTLAGAVPGFQAFSVIGNGNTTYYSITDGTNWEVGVGTYTSSGTTLSRDTILESSNSGSAVNWGAGTKDIFVTYPAERSVYLNAAGLAVDVLDIGTLGTTTANISTANITAGTVSATPTNSTDLVNKTYVDSLVVSGVHFHEPVRVESPINLNATYNNGTSGVGATLTNAGTQVALVIDGVTLSVSDRVLIYQQTNQVQNGIYVVSNVGSGSTNWVLTRATDADSYGLASPDTLGEGSTVFVQQGATGAGETYTCNTPGTITFGTTNITFAQVSSAQIYSAGTGLTLTGTQFSLSNVGTAGTYGSASQVPVITTNAQGQVSSVTNTNIAIAGSAITSGTVAVANGGTGQSSYTNGQLLIGNTTGNTLAKATLTAGTGISVTNGAGSITVAATNNGTVTSVSGTGTVNGITLSGTVTSSGSLTLGGTLSGVSLSTQVTGTLPIANGGSGQTTAQAAMNAFAGAVTSGSYLRGNGTNVVMSTIQAGDVPTLNQNTTGTAANVTGTVAIANGGTGATTNTAARTNLGATTLGSNLFTITNPSAVTFPRFNADNTVSSLDAASFRTAIGAGTSSTTGTVTSVSGTGSVNGITLSGTVTSSGNLTLGGTLSGVSLSTQVTGTLPVANGGTGITSFGTGVATWLGTPSSANLAAAVTDETGSGSLVFATSPTLSNPLIAKQNTSGEGGEIQLQKSDTSTLSGNLVIDLFSNSLRIFESTGTNRGVSLDISAQTAGAAGVILTNSNYNSYSPTLTGTGASGTWGITVTGSAATLTTARTIQTNLASTSAASFNGSANITPGVTGTLAVANGGTGQTTYTNGQLLIGNTTGNTLTKATLTAGSGISITNGAGAITIAATGGGTGTVTSVALSGGTTGITVSGSPITTSGTMTLGGTLAVANGGTGATVASTALSNLGGYPASNPNGYTSNTGTVTNVSGTGTVNGISLSGSVSSSGSLSLSGGISGVSLTSAVSGTLPIGNGGTNSTATPTAGGIAYGTGSAFAFSSAGTAGQVLTSGGTGAPTWSSSSFSFPSGGSATAPGYGFSGDTNTGVFSPAADTLGITTNGVECGRFTSAQRFFIGRTTQLLTDSLVTFDTTAQACLIVGVTNNNAIFTVNKGTSTYEALNFRNNTSTQVGSVVCTASATTYGTSSDYRLKENVQPMVGALTKLAQLKPVTYDWKSSGLPGEGFIAHELQEVLPSAVVGEKDAVNEDGSVKPQNVDYGKLTPILTAALQEALKKIETLEARIAALEAK